ncbi:EAL domain-containing protein [Nisaea acidiphila]|uniref:EAL domain-containing protein n=1 Tax=Nisaea acidiphila TaxID=1862145 RepID=A0A9J7AXY9_9PROT|nr:EAL domain-containing protein [Nisaea acidiphila]UUX51666.1 EAL domain-containing protein [Nisaea acidiphila]
MRNVLIASFYVFPAIAVAVLLPVVPLLGLPGWGAGLFLLIVGGLVQSGLALRTVRASSERQLEVLAHELAVTRQDLDAAREEVSRIREQIDEMPDSGHVVAELKVLQGLLGQLSAKTPDKPKAKPSAEKKPVDDIGLPAVAAAEGHGEPLLLIDDAEVLTIVEQALREDRVDLYLQPIVSLPSRKRQFYECFSRIVDDRGRVITPEQYIPLAEEAGLVAVIDNMLLFRCIQLVRRAVRGHPELAFFCNISNGSLTDVDFFTDFIEFLSDNQKLIPNLYFEFEQDAITDPSYETQVNLQRLQDLGFHFSLDQVRTLDIDLPHLADLGFKYIKVGAHMLHEMARGDDPMLDMRRFKGALDRCAMDLIVEKIETEDMLLDLLDLKIDFGQGYLFGEPRPTTQPAK